MKGSFRLKSRIFCNLNSYYILIQWCCLTLVCIFLYYWTCRQCSISQPELYSQEEFRAGIAWSIACKALIEREMKQKQFHCLNKLIDFKTGEGRQGPGWRGGGGEGSFVYYLLFNSILKSRGGGGKKQVSEHFYHILFIPLPRRISGNLGTQLVSPCPSNHICYNIYCWNFKLYFLSRIPGLT